MKYLISLIVLVSVFLLLINIYEVKASENVWKIVKSIIIFLISTIIFYEISIYIRKSKIEKAENISTLVLLTGIIISSLIALSIFGVSLSGLLIGGTFGGFIIGLALQPIIGNLFAGILILVTRYIEVGSKIRILTSQIPYQVSMLPAYKFFSVDNIDIGYVCMVKEIGFFFSQLVTEDGKLLKVPNLVLMNSIVMNIGTEESDYRVVSIRIEFPIKLKKVKSLDKLEKMIKSAIKEYKVIEGPYFNEQSDKENIIIQLKVESKWKEWKKTKSEILKKLMDLRRRLS